MTKTGKTTVSDRLVKTTGYERVSGSTWVKARYAPPPGVEMGSQEYLRGITAYSCEALKANPNACVDYIRAHHDVDGGCLILEGLRNPRDFTLLFRPEHDRVILLNYPENPIVPTDFERHGVRAIRDTLEWMVTTGMLDPARILKINLGGLHGTTNPAANERYETPMPIACRNLDEAMDASVAWVAKTNPGTPPSQVLAKVHAPIYPFPVWVDNRVLHDMDPTVTGWTRGRAYAVNSYKGHAPTFEVLLENGAVFSYVPAHMLWWKWLNPGDSRPEKYEAKDLTYALCPDGTITVNAYDLLVGEKCKAYFVRPGVCENALYLFTVDWVDDNLLLHAVALDNGQVALLPSHKVLFGKGTELPKYKKLHQEWTKSTT